MPTIVYTANLSLFSADACLPLLTKEERKKAAAVAHTPAREEFVKCRALLRALLSNHTGEPPSTIEITTGPFGKPVLASTCGLHFNVSHSGGVALFAISSVEVGVDIERMDTALDHRAIATTVFSPSELDMLDGAAAGNGPEVFFSLWTRKEAYLKATGRGFSSDLLAISVDSDDRRVLDCSDEWNGKTWHIHDLNAPAGFKAALVSSEADLQVELQELASGALLEPFRSYGRSDPRRARSAMKAS